MTDKSLQKKVHQEEKNLLRKKEYEGQKVRYAYKMIVSWLSSLVGAPEPALRLLLSVLIGKLGKFRHFHLESEKNRIDFPFIDFSPKKKTFLFSSSFRLFRCSLSYRDLLSVISSQQRQLYEK